MTRFVAMGMASLVFAGSAGAQVRAGDWPFFGGDAQRTGWEKAESRITKENVKDFELVWKRKFDNQQKGPRSLTPPVVIGRLISYRGFKELAFVSGSPDNLWALDVDLNRMFWQKRLESTADKKSSGGSAVCASAVTAMPSLTPPINFAARGARPGAPTARGPNGAIPAPTSAGAPAGPKGILGGGGFGAARPAFAVSSDGKLHVLNTSNGDDVTPAIEFLPASAKASSLTVLENVIYTITNGGCGGAADGVWAIDLNSTEPKIASFPLHGGSSSFLGGMAIGTDGTLYVQTGAGPSDPDSNKWSNTLLALTPKDLKLKHHFTIPGGPSTGKAGAVTPVVFTYKEHDMIVSPGSDGRLYLLDSNALDGADHQQPVYRTPPLTTSGRGLWGGLSSWQDADGTRWIYAPVWGAVNPELKAPMANGAAPNGAIVAFKLEDVDGKPALTPAWVSRDMSSPQPPVIANGVLFALSAGDYATEDKPKSTAHATLYGLDGGTGKELYSTGNQVTSPGTLTGLTLANGRVYFTTIDNTLYAFGVHMEI